MGNTFTSPEGAGGLPPLGATAPVVVNNRKNTSNNVTAKAPRINSGNVESPNLLQNLEKGKNNKNKKNNGAKAPVVNTIELNVEKANVNFARNGRNSPNTIASNPNEVAMNGQIGGKRKRKGSRKSGKANRKSRKGRKGSRKN